MVTSLSRSDQSRLDHSRVVRNWPVEFFHRCLAEAGIERAFVLYENGCFRLSHPKQLAPIQAYLELSQDFSNHEGIFIGREEGIPSPFFAFVHDTRRGLAQGGLRLRNYQGLGDLLTDGLRLAQGMTRKNALAGLWWGGGKGILPLPPGLDTSHEMQGSARQSLFEAYGRFVASLGGVYYTAEDVGAVTTDMDAVLSQNRFTTCISRRLGGSGNPSPHTARGVLRGMQAAWLFLTGTESLRTVKIAVQGVGNVGGPLASLLHQAGARVVVGDPNQEAVQELLARHPGMESLPPDRILFADAGILAPCAIGAQVNATTIPDLKVRLVCGAANNILGEPDDARRLMQRDIAFVPDFLCNRMGITNCADEWMGYLESDIELAAERVFPDTLRVLKHARNLVITTTQAAHELADIAACELHPLMGHRGRRIIDDLVQSGWHKKGQETRFHRSSRAERGKPPLQPIFTPALDEPPILRRWEREDRFSGQGQTLASTPVSAAASPNLAAFLSPLLMDIRARALERLTGRAPRRVIGADHGGLALQLAVERSLPYERQEVGRADFVRHCRDVYNRNDAAIREQLHQLGIGYDPRSWLDPMEEEGRRVAERLFHTLQDSRRLVRENRMGFRCPRCETVIVASDVIRTRLERRKRTVLRFATEDGPPIVTRTFFPELILGAVALAVRIGGPYESFAGTRVKDPLLGRKLPVLALDGMSSDAEFLAPAHDRSDERVAREQGFTDYPRVFDHRGRVTPPGREPMSVEDAREAILKELGETASVETGHWHTGIQRCRRCETIVIPEPSDQLFLHLEDARGHLAQAIRSGALAFSKPTWRDRVLEFLNSAGAHCISRQAWWGQEIPRRRGDAASAEVFSSWFTMAALTLQGMGWPDDPAPEPIDEVHTDPDFLLRWVVPSLLVSCEVTGRPAFRRVQVHGSLHVHDRELASTETSPEIAGESENSPVLLDEERFRYRTASRPMRRTLGNVVEPGTLVRRFGADSLRLGYLLCLRSSRLEVVTAAESHLREGRRILLRFGRKVTGLFDLLRDGSRGPADHPADLALLETMQNIQDSAMKAYEEHRLVEAARLLVDASDAFASYTNQMAQRIKVNDPAVSPAAATEALQVMAGTFSPICPFLFEKILAWLQEAGHLEE